jgi:hypothetical protein
MGGRNKLKKLRFLSSFFLCLALFSFITAGAVSAAGAAVIEVDSGEVSNPHKYTVDDSGVLTKYEGPGGALTIPNEVVSIGTGIFQGKPTILTVNFESPPQIKSIGKNAFYNSSGLTSIELPDTLEVIDDYALSGTSLTAVTIPDGVKELGVVVFYNCKSLRTITIPAGVKELRSSAFYDCTSLESITIPDSVETLGDSVFRGCTSLKSITIPASVKEFGLDFMGASNAFYGCTSLEEVFFYSIA